MIPKVIHYCWFGRNPKSGLILECINSWKEHCSDYQIIEWNEDNFDVNVCDYVKEAYNAKKWAFVSDYARLFALYNYGGIYMDTDVELLKPLDVFLREKMFTGYETNDSPITALMGAEPHSDFVFQLMSYYDDKHFQNTDGSLNLVTNTHIISDAVLAQGLIPNGKKQTVGGMTVYPSIYFCPNNISRIFNIPSRQSYAIHHFDQSWKSEKKDSMSFSRRIRRYAVGVLRNTIGTKNIERLRK